MKVQSSLRFLRREEQDFRRAAGDASFVSFTTILLRQTVAALLALAFLLGCVSNASAQNTIWLSTATPAVVDVGPDSAVELGVSFKADNAGNVTGIRFYKSVGNTGQHVAHLWSASGALLATATFTGETASGWQQVNFSTPVAIAANTVYVASYHSTLGHWSANWSYFANSGTNNPPLHAPQNGHGASNGVFAYGSSGTFPKNTHQSANYWVDVVFAGTSPAPLKIATSQLSGSAVGLAYSAALAATGGVTPYTWSLLSGTLPSGLSVNAGGTISGTPTLAGLFSFTVQVKDAAGKSASATFSINVSLPQPTINTTAPANGSTVSGTITVAGTAADTVGLTAVQVSIDHGSFSNGSGTANWTYVLNTSTLSNATHTISAKVIDVAGMAATSSPMTVTVNNGALATNCTLYAAASGNDGNSGTSPTAPKTFLGAAAMTVPGSVVCLLGGTYQMNDTFYPPSSGTPSSWIVYEKYGDGDVNFTWTAGAIAQPMFKFGNGSFPSGAAYLEFDGLKLDGQGNALDGFFCNGGHHLRFNGNTINNTGGSGVGAVNCDYLTSDHNLIDHNGYLYGWTSAISYNNVPWFDSFSGFHNVISNNIVVGEYDGSSNHTDGNGIILDLGGNTPAALIVNNVVYGNGGRCIQANGVSNFWVVNNTCYKNNLDTSLGNAGSFTSQNSTNGYFVNNITVAWHTNNPSYDQEGSNSSISYYADMYSGSSINFTPPDPSQLISADPLFFSPPFFDPNASGQYATALPPGQLGNDLTLLATSPAYNRGIDPSQLSGVPANIVAGLKQYIYVDITGKVRPQGGGSDLGAYQH